jgi:hypothetical protein
MKKLNLKPVIIWGVALIFCVQFIGSLGFFDPPPFHRRIDDPRIVLGCVAKCAVVVGTAYLVHRWTARKSKSI